MTKRRRFTAEFKARVCDTSMTTTPNKRHLLANVRYRAGFVCSTPNSGHSSGRH